MRARQMMPVARDDVVRPVEERPREHPRGPRDVPEAAQITRYLQRRRRSDPDALGRLRRRRFHPHHRIDSSQLRMTAARRGAVRTLQRRKAQRAAAVVLQDQLDASRTEAARPVIEQHGGHN